MTAFSNIRRGSKLYIVVPCYNEEDALPETTRLLREKTKKLIIDGIISEDSKVLLVNDGSTDLTWQLIEKLHKTDPLFCGVSLSRNRGHQNALLAGLMIAKERSDFTVSIDADLQDDIDAVDEMIEHYYDGCEIVYGVRSSRSRDRFFKRFTAEAYYKLLNKLGGEIIYNHADYRLMSKNSLDALSNYNEVNLFLRGIVPMLGYKTASVKYVRGERTAGESKYPLKKMLTLATDGITSLSSKPIRFFLWSGIASIVADFILLFVFIVKAMSGSSFDISKTLLLVTLMLGGLILSGIGVVGEYVGKIYLETKQRPRYFIEKFLE